MKKSMLILFVLAFAFVSCEVAGLNENVKDPTEVPPEPLFTTAQFRLGNYLQNINVNTNIFNMMAQHWSTGIYTSESRYEIDRRTIPSNIFSIFYANSGISGILINLKKAEEFIRADELAPPAVKQNKLASIDVVQALAYSKLVDIFGNIPYTEALNPDDITPAYDDAQTIYLSLIDSLNAAIGAFNPSAASFGTNDIYYNGDVNSWITFANSLKLRLGIMLADVDPETAQTVVESAVAGGVFTSAADNAMIPFQSAPPYTNPVWENEVQNNRDDFVNAAPLVSRMNNLNDPRREIFFTQVGGEYIGAPYAEAVTVSNFSRFTDLVLQRDRPGMILSYSEVEFILAEAAARGYAVSGTAEEHYNAAIRADMEYWGVPDAEITAYLAQPEVAYDPAGDFRQQIGVQKWLSLYLQGLQAWTSYRRLDAPDLTVPGVVVVTDIVPRRFTYPIEEERFNSQELQQAIDAMGGDVLTNRLFWDVQGPGQ